MLITNICILFQFDCCLTEKNAEQVERLQIYYIASYTETVKLQGHLCVKPFSNITF